MNLTSTRRTKQPVSLSQTQLLIYGEAIKYYRRGWSIIPMNMQQKTPAVSWTPFQSAQPEEKFIHGWWKKPGNNFGVGVVFGPASGYLGSRDFDELDGYIAWAQKFPGLARALPTVATRRGRHVYFRYSQDAMERIRTLLGKPDGKGSINCEDGELRAGPGCYSVLPPSVHPSGHVYSWIVPLPEGPLPEVDPLAAGFLPGIVQIPLSVAHATERHRELQSGQRQTESTEAIRKEKEEKSERGTKRPSSTTTIGQCLASLPVVQQRRENIPVDSDREEAVLDVSNWGPYSHLLGKHIQGEELARLVAGLTKEEIQAVVASLPRAVGTRNKQVFGLARAVKAIPGCRDAPAKAFKHVVKAWHAIGVAMKVIATQEVSESLMDFYTAWGRVKFPAGEEPMVEIIAKAKSRELPACASQVEDEKPRFLVAVCAELQRSVGDAPFFISVRTAAKVLDLHFTHAARMLRYLEQEGILAVIEKGSQTTGKATRFRYLGDL